MFDLDFNSNTLALVVLCLLIVINLNWMISNASMGLEIDKRKKSLADELQNLMQNEFQKFGATTVKDFDALLHISSANRELKQFIEFQKSIIPSPEGKSAFFNKDRFPDTEFYHLSIISLEEDSQEFFCNQKLTFTFNSEKRILSLYDDMGNLLISNKVDNTFNPRQAFRVRNTSEYVQQS